MRSFAEVVGESFDSETVVNWRLTGTTRAAANFAVGSVTVEVNIRTA